MLHTNLAWVTLVFYLRVSTPSFFFLFNNTVFGGQRTLNHLKRGKRGDARGGVGGDGRWWLSLGLDEKKISWGNLISSQKEGIFWAQNTPIRSNNELFSKDNAAGAICGVMFALLQIQPAYMLQKNIHYRGIVKLFLCFCLTFDQVLVDISVRWQMQPPSQTRPLHTRRTAR